jgi:hypothetical protein
MNAVIGMSRMLMESDLEPHLYECAETIESSGKRQKRKRPKDTDLIHLSFSPRKSSCGSNRRYSGLLQNRVRATHFGARQVRFGR